MASMSLTSGLPREKQTFTPRTPRRASFSIPERFKDGDDADIDITAPKSKRSAYMNQSFLSMIANVGSNATLDPQFALDAPPNPKGNPPLYKKADTYSNVDEPFRSGSLPQSAPEPPSEQKPGRDGDRLSALPPEGSPVKDSPKRIRRPRHLAEGMETSQILTRPTAVSPRQESKSKRTASRPSRLTAERHVTPGSSSSAIPRPDEAQPGTDHTDLATTLARVYGFKKPEEVDAEFPCWLLQSALLQGHMYITNQHVCFFAYLRRKPTEIMKSGYFYKRGRQNPRYRRYWFVLRGSVLSYYSSPNDLYFPRGTFDLRSGTTAELDREEASQQPLDFTISASGQVHRFRGESATSAFEWVKQLQKSIYHAQNDGGSVKISLPIANMVDVEENPVLDFADTFKIRIIDNDETFAIDEYFFSFFNHGQDALEILRARISKNALHRDNLPAPKAEDAVKEPCLEVVTSPSNVKSKSMLASEDTSIDERTTQTTESSVSIQSGSHSANSASPDDQSNLSDQDQPFDTSSASASQILQHSDVFYRPSKQQRHGHAIPQRDSSDDTTPGNRIDADKQPKPTTEANDQIAQSQNSPTLPQSWSTSTIQDFLRIGTGSAKGASGVADLLRTHSKRVSHVIAGETKVYYEKVTNMWSGKTTHFDADDGAATGGGDVTTDEEEGADSAPGDRFRSYFALPVSEKLIATYHGYLNRVVPVFGKIYVSDANLCFRSLLPGTRTKMILPLKDIETVEKEKGFRFGYSGLVVIVRGHEELFLEFSQSDTRDDLRGTIIQFLPMSKQLDLPSDDATPALTEDAAREEYDSLLQAKRSSPGDQDGVFQTVSIEQDEAMPIIFDDLSASIIDFKPVKPLRITCLTIGSRGDVQPYIALCKGLLEEGHKPRIVTHVEFEPWIRYHGIDFAPVAGDPAEIMRLCVEHDMFTVSFFREATSKFRGWIDQLLNSSWKSCQDSDVIIESPSAMAGIHIAEALEIPYFRAFTMPWTRTRAYPHAFAVPNQKLGGNYNLLSYVMFDNVFWRAVAGQLNRWRGKTLGLPPTNLDKLQINKVPFLYNFSPSVVPPPLDFSPWIRVTGYWFLDERETYTPPAGLADFIAQARIDQKKVVYVGFGSIVIDDPAALTKTIVESVLKADVRCILSKGWSDRLEKRKENVPDFPLPKEIYSIKSAPHDWLFQQIDAAAHHGGAGTTGASLRAGIPTIVKPFFGDQFFFGSRVETLGVGRCLTRINTSVFARALWEITNSERMIVKARLLGEQIRSEDGVDTAIQAIYRDLEYATSLVKSHGKVAAPVDPEDTEDWTLVGDGSDSETAPRNAGNESDET